LNYLNTYLNDKKLDAFVFIVHNMDSFKTTYYLITKKKIEKKEYSSYTSRGSTIMPEIEKKLKKEF